MAAPGERLPAALAERLGLVFIERDWLSSNMVAFKPQGSDGAALIDSGHVRHVDMTCALVQSALGSHSLERLLNTHLHSDHCGGNAQLQRRHGCLIQVPQPSFSAAVAWDQGRLTHTATGQACEPFRPDEALPEQVHLAGRRWDVIPCPGHDPDAVMFYQADDGVLISGDALWERRTAINFEAFSHGDGFLHALETLDQIRQLAPAWVLPGHGSPFDCALAAIDRSAQQLQRFQEEPTEHAQRAAISLCTFHLLETGACTEAHLLNWLCQTPLFAEVHQRGSQEVALLEGQRSQNLADWAADVIETMWRRGIIEDIEGLISLKTR